MIDVIKKSFHRLYHKNDIVKARVDALYEERKITQEEYEYIVGSN